MQVIDVIIVGDAHTGKKTFLNNLAGYDILKIPKTQFGKSKNKNHVNKTGVNNLPHVKIPLETNYGTFNLQCFVGTTQPLDLHYDVAFIVVDVTNNTTILNVDYWCQMIRKYNDDAEIIICVNKSDYLRTDDKTSSTTNAINSSTNNAVTSSTNNAITGLITSLITDSNQPYVCSI